VGVLGAVRWGGVAGQLDRFGVGLAARSAAVFPAVFSANFCSATRAIPMRFPRRFWVGFGHGVAARPNRSAQWRALVGVVPYVSVTRGKV